MRLLWLVLTLLLAACDNTPQPATPVTAKYSGSATCQSCQSCHAAQYNDWLQSHHQLAMQKASSATILGQFPAAPLTHHGQSSEFNANRSISSESQTLSLAYTFGLYPLQQYLSPQANGALQALPQAWDSRAKADGGQRWFHLHSEENISGAGDALHWASPSHNANHMCIECHTTGYQKQVSADGQSFNSQWQEIGVGCESCHGPAANHVNWAQTAVSAAIPATTAVLANKGFERELAAALSFVRQTDRQSKPHAEQVADYHPQTEQCASCHSRRARISDEADIKSLYDSFMPSLIDSSLYHVDGQIKDEVFEYGSFMQSKMAHAGVTCSNCHNPHSAQLKIEGNGLCLQCHSDEFNQPKHTLHPLGSAGSQCIDCHMPVTTYMQVDDRRDHSFRIPRPDLSDKLGTPNACQQCHSQTNTELSQLMQSHYGSDWQQPHYGEVFWRAERGYRDSLPKLIAIVNSASQPQMVRAQALSLLGQLQPQAQLDADALSSSKPLLQLAVLSNSPATNRLDPQQLFTLLEDAPAAIKFEAFRWLSFQTEYHRDARYQAVRKNYVASLMINADRAPSRTALAQLLFNEQQVDAAIAELEQAIKLEPYYVPATINLTDIFRSQQRDAEAKPYFAKALQLAADSADLQHAYGLWLVRQGDLANATKALQQAANLSERPYYRYVYALALAQAGDEQTSFTELLQAADNEHYDPTVLQAAAEQAAQRGRFHALRKIIAKWQQFDAEHPALKQLEQWLAQAQ